MLFVCIILPLHIAFNNEEIYWCYTYNIFDFIFLIDLCIQFFTTIPETEDTNEIVSRSKIAIEYLKSWFAIDLLSIMPFEIIMSIGSGTFNGVCNCEPSVLAESAMILKASKIGKILKIVRMLRLIKILKLMKNTEQLK